MLRIPSAVLAIALGFTVQQGAWAHGKGKHTPGAGSDESAAGHSHARSEIHGGQVVMTKQFHFEIVWSSDGIAVYPYDQDQKAIPAKGMTGDVVLVTRSGKERKLPLEVVSGSGAAASHLVARLDLSKAQSGRIKARFVLGGLPDRKEPTATFASKFHGFAPPRKSPDPHHGSGDATGSSSSEDAHPGSHDHGSHEHGGGH